MANGQCSKHKLREVVVELTSQCNLSCLHCGSDCQQSFSGNELQVFEWKKLIDQLFQMGVKKIHFSGGEPTLKKGFEEIVAHTSSKIRFSLITNGFFLSQKLYDFLLQHKPFAVGVSFDGTRKTHNLIRNHPESWDRAVKTIMRLKDAGIQVCLITTVNKLNSFELFEIANLASFFEVDSWQLQLMMPFGRSKIHLDLLINEEIFRQVCLEIVSFREAFPHINIVAADCFGWAPPGLIRKEEWNGCAAGLSGCGIDAHGNVLPCLSLKSGGLPRESVREKTIWEIWEKSSIFNLNRRFDFEAVKGVCFGCQKLNECRGGCASQSASYFQKFHCSPFCFWRTFSKKSREEK